MSNMVNPTLGSKAEKRAFYKNALWIMLPIALQNLMDTAVNSADVIMLSYVSQDALSAAGYLPYYMYRQKNTVGNLENVGYSKPGHEGLYNIYMMDELHSIFACGASSVTKIVTKFPDGKPRIERIFEPKYPYEYLKAREDGSWLKTKEENEAFIRQIYDLM